MKVRVSPNARAQLRERRDQLAPKSSLRRALGTELPALLKLLETSPEIGTPAGSLVEDAMVRRSYLKQAQLYVFHALLPGWVEIIAVWPARSGTSPRFGGAKH